MGFRDKTMIGCCVAAIAFGGLPAAARGAEVFAATVTGPAHNQTGTATLNGAPLPGDLSEARSMFGHPGSVVRHGQDCEVSWPGAGVTGSFTEDYSAIRNGCVGGSGLVTLTGRTRAWRTTRGLAVGDPVSDLHRLYPSARIRGGVARLVTYFYGGGYRITLLGADVKDGRVVGVFAAGIPDD